MREVARRNVTAATVVLEGGAIPRAWQARHPYQTGDVVTPHLLDGFSYVATAANGAVSGDTEPAFVAGTTPDNGINWTQSTPVQPQAFTAESTRTTFPAGVT